MDCMFVLDYANILNLHFIIFENNKKIDLYLFKSTTTTTFNNHIINHMESATTFYPLEINGTKYLICKLPEQPFSTLHDPNTKQIVGQWNNDEARYEITDHIAQFEMINGTPDNQAAQT